MIIAKKLTMNLVSDNKNLILLFFVAILSIACTPSRYVEPLPTNTFNITVAGGGALFDYQDKTIPLPLTSVIAGYGINKETSLWGGLHTTSAVYGVLHTELGGIKRIYQGDQNIPSISVSPSAHIMIDKWESNKRFYPVLDINFYWRNLFTSDLFYIGLNNWFELSQRKAHNRKQEHHWIPSLQSGYSYRPDNMQYTFEMKYIAPNYSNQDIVVDYMSPTDQGALGLYFSVGRSF